MSEDIIVNFLTEKNEPVKALDGITDSADEATKSTNLTGGAMRGLKSAAIFGAGGAALAIAGLGTAAFNVSLDTKNAATSMSASLGIPIAKAEEFADVAQDVFANNFGASVTEAGEVVGILAQQIDSLADDGNGMQAAAEDAFALRDVFKFDVNESIDAADTLMENFGLSSEEAFDMIAAGTQNGLNRSDDFLDTIGEYSTQFAEGGATAEQFFNFLESGLQGGVLGTDKAADAFKEFRLRINDGTDATREAVAQLFLSEQAADSFFAEIESGKLTSVQAFSEIRDALVDVENPVERMQLGTALLGTQFEDLGDTAVAELAFVGNSFKNVENATESLSIKYNTFGDMASAIGRRVIVAITPITDKLLDMANNAMPHVERAFAVFEAKIVPAINSTAHAITWATDLINGMFRSNEFSNGVTHNIAILRTFSDWFSTNLPLIQRTVETVTNAMSEFWNRHGTHIMSVVNNTFSTIFTVIDTTLKTILNLITLVLAAINGDWELFGQTLRKTIGDVFSGLSTAVSNSMGSISAVFAMAFDGLPDIIATAMSGAKNAITIGGRSLLSGLDTTFSRDAFGQKTADAMVGMVDTINNVYANLFPHMKTQSDRLLAKMKEGFNKGGLNGLANAAMSGLSEGYNFRMDNMIIHVAATVKTMVDKFSQHFNWDTLRGIAHRAMDGLLVGLNDKFGAARNKIAEIGNMMPDTIKNLLGIQSPSKVMQGIAKDFMQPIENLDAGAVQISAAGVADGLTVPFDGVGGSSSLGPQTTNNSSSVTNIFQVTVNAAGSGADQINQTIDELAFRYNANVVGA